MTKFNLSKGENGDYGSGFPIRRLVPMDCLYSFIRQCEPESLSQALNLYIAGLERLGLPDAVAASYLQVEALMASARILQDSGSTDGEMPSELTCPRFSAMPDGFLRCCEWSYNLLRSALDYRLRYNGRTGNLGIARARYYIDQHFTDPDLMLKDAAGEAKMSLSRFSTVFAREMNRTFTEYVTELRIGKARQLLTETPMRIAQIAGEVGYNDPHYFSWIFRKVTGCTPTDYREAAGRPGTAEGKP